MYICTSAHLHFCTSALLHIYTSIPLDLSGMGQLYGYVEVTVAIQLNASEESLGLVSQDFNYIRGMAL